MAGSIESEDLHVRCATSSKPNSLDVRLPHFKHTESYPSARCISPAELWKILQTEVFCQSEPRPLSNVDGAPLLSAGLKIAQKLLTAGGCSLLRELIQDRIRGRFAVDTPNLVEPVRLCLDVEDGVSDAMAIPWELLSLGGLMPSQPLYGKSLSQHDDVLPYRRYPVPKDSTPQSWLDRPVEVTPDMALRVLVIVDGPVDATRSGYAHNVTVKDIEEVRSTVEEIQRLFNKRNSTDRIPLEFGHRIELLQNPSKEELRQALQITGHRGDWNTVVWIGHVIEPCAYSQQYGALTSVREQSTWEAQEFAETLHHAPELRLAMILGCRSSQFIAPPLIRSGVPAVIANQMPVYTGVQPRWMKVFLTALLENSSESPFCGRIDLAYQKMRNGLANFERCVPVLHLHGNSFRLLNRDADMFWLTGDGQLPANILSASSDLDRLRANARGVRDDVGEIFTSLATNPTGWTFIVGSPGVGKSTVAAEIYHKARGHSMRAIHFFERSRGSSCKPESLFSTLLAQISPILRHNGIATYDGHAGCSADELAHLFQVTLKDAANLLQASKQRLIILLDGFDETIDARESVTDYFPCALPPNVCIIVLSQPVAKLEEFYQSLKRKLGEQTVRRFVLNGLSHEGVLALLRGRETIDHIPLPDEWGEQVAVASGGNPMYIRLLLDDLTKMPGDAFVRRKVPTGLPGWYEKKLNEIKSTSSRRELLFDLLSIFAIVSEQLTSTQLAEIVTCSSRDDVEEELASLLPFLHAKLLSNGDMAYRLFHQSLRDYLTNRYRDRLEQAERWVVAWACECQGSGLSLIERLRQGQLARADRKHLSDVVHGCGQHPSAQQIIIKWASEDGRLAPLIDNLWKCPDSRASSLGLSGALLRNLREHSPSAFMGTVETLLRQEPLAPGVMDILIETLYSPRASSTLRSLVCRVVSNQLRQIPPKPSAKLWNWRERVINSLALMLRHPPVQDESLEVSGHLLDIPPINAMSGDFLTPTATSRLVKWVIKSKALWIGINAIRAQIFANAAFTGTESGAILFRSLLKAAISPKNWSRTLPMLAVSLPRVGTRPIYLYKMFRGFSAVMDIWQRGLALVFAGPNNPAKSLRGLEYCEHLERYLLRVDRAFGGGETSLLGRFAEELGSAVKDQRCANAPAITSFFFVQMLFMAPLLADMWNYSVRGLDSLLYLAQDDRQRCITLSPYLLPEKRLTEAQFSPLVDLLLADDGWQNYQGMLTLIIHSPHQFEYCARCLDEMLVRSPYGSQSSQVDCDRIRLKHFRQYLVLFAYFFRRTHAPAVRRQMVDVYLSKLALFRTELVEHDSMLQAFAKPTLFGHADPFVPLLPLGIIAFENSVDLGGRYAEVFVEQVVSFLAIAIDQPAASARAIRTKLIAEFIAIALFDSEAATHLALRTMKVDHEKFGTSGHTDWLDLFRIISEFTGGMVQYWLQRDTSEEAVCLRSEIMHGDIQPVMREMASVLPRAINILGWHEMLTTVVTEMPVLWHILHPHVADALRSRLSGPEMGVNMLVDMMKDYFARGDRAMEQWLSTTNS